MYELPALHFSPPCFLYQTVIFLVLTGRHPHPCFVVHEPEAPSAFHEEDNEKELDRHRIPQRRQGVHSTRGWTIWENYPDDLMFQPRT